MKEATKPDVYLNNVRSYDRIAEEWDRYRRGKPVDPAVVSLADRLPEGAEVLDVGCGTGIPIDRYLAGRGYLVTGIDPSGNMLEKAASLALPGAVFLRSDLDGFRTEKTFDAAVAFDSLFHVPAEAQRAIYPKIASLLKPGGLFLFTHGKKAGEAKGTMFGEKFFYAALDRDDLVGCLEKAGLGIVELYEDYSDPVTGERDLLVLAKRSEGTPRAETEEGTRCIP